MAGKFPSSCFSLLTGRMEATVLAWQACIEYPSPTPGACPAGISLWKSVLAAVREQSSSHYLSELLHLHPAGIYESVHCQEGFLLFHSRTAPAWSQSSQAPAARVHKQINNFLVSFLLFPASCCWEQAHKYITFTEQSITLDNSLIHWVFFLTLHFNFLLAVKQ